MAFTSQLRLLLWKNFILRKRQKIRCLVELIWPLFLFSILMWVRTRGLKLYRHECHFQQKAMPSTGALAFFQSFICTFNNTCHNHVVNEDLSNFLNQSVISRLIDDVERIGSDEVKMEQMRNIERVMNDVKGLAAVIGSVAKQERRMNGSLNLKNIVKDPKILRDKLTSDPINLNKSVADTIIDSNLLLYNFSLDVFLKSDARKVLCSPNYLKNAVSSVSHDEMKIAVNELCGLEEEKINKIFVEIGRQLNRTLLFEQMSQYLKNNLDDALNWDDWFEMVSLSRKIIERMSSLETYQDFTSEVTRVGEEYQSIVQSVQEKSGNNSSGLEAILRYLQYFLCGKNSTDFIDQLKAGGGQSTRFDEIRDQLKDSTQQEGFSYVNDTTASPECNEIFRILESDVVTRYLWNMVKPFVRGKILYAPKMASVNEVMKRVNDTFAPLGLLREAIDIFLNAYLPSLRQSSIENEESFNIIKEYLETDEGKFLDNLGRENATRSPYSNLQTLINWFSDNITSQEEFYSSISDSLTNISRFLDCFDLDKVQGFETEEEAVAEGMNLIESNRLWAVVSFLGLGKESYNSSSLLLPPKVTYKIRIDSSRVDSTKRVEDSITNPGSRRRPAIDLKYITFGFAYLQDMIDGAIISEVVNEEDFTMPGIFLQQFPYPCHIIDQFVLAISRTFPMFMTLSWVYTCAMIVKSIVREKERRLRETMKAMGLRSSALWLAWFIDSFIFMLLVIAVLTTILTKGKVLENSDPSVIFVFITLYAIATITQCFFMSVFFSRANLAAAAGGILFFVTYLPYSFMVQWEERMPTGAKIAASLFSNVAFGFGCSYFAHYEEMGVGIQWNNIDSSPLLGDHYSLIGCAGMFIVDSVLYSMLTWYIETVFPGQYGIPKPWYFPFMRSYWLGDSRADSMVENTIPSASEKLPATGDDFEKEPTHLPLGVSLQGLTKIYGHSSNKKVAVRDLSVNFYQDQITSFLGHNGAGKTTTISILTGLFPPTSGTAKVYGLDIRKNMDSIRKSLGTCPQHNVLFDELTVEEHLWFYARLRGRPKGEIFAEMDEMILDLGLPHKRWELAKNLSGGMQRKLSIAVAFVGGSRTVVLDEPTSGVDPYSRRSIWELLIKYKKGRTVILTTHFMDEADLLGDRIAIISHGRLRCCGSSLFLKARFGKGYYLTVERKEAALISGSQNCESAKETDEKNVQEEKNEEDKPNAQGDCTPPDDLQQAASQISINKGTLEKDTKGSHSDTALNITQFIRESVPDALLLEEVGSELLYLLPSKRLQDVQIGNARISAAALENLFDRLDSEMTRLGLNSYGVSDTTLEEIFLKVTEEGDKIEDGGKGGNREMDSNLLGLPQKKIGISRLRELLDLRKMLSKLCKKKSISYENNLIRESAKKQIVIQYKGNHVTYQDIPCSDNGVVNSVAIEGESIVQDGRLSLTSDGSKLPPAIVYAGLGKKANDPPTIGFEILNDNRLLFQQFKALLAKRYSRTKRNPKALFFEIVLPAIFVCLALVFTVLQPGLRQEPPLHLSPWLYGPPNYVFFSNDNQSVSSPSVSYEEELFGPTGMGVRCIVDEETGKRNSYCRGEIESWPEQEVGNFTSPECSCAVGTQQCPPGAGGPHPPQAQASTGDYMLNLTARNISDWLVKTNKEYFKMRYGGFTLGMKNNLCVDTMKLIEIILKLIPFKSNFSTSLNDFTQQLRVKSKNCSIENNIKVWFNNKGWASSVSYMSAISNVVLRSSISDSHPYDHDQYGIQVINHPMNFTDVQMSQELFKQSGVSLLHAISVIFALSFVPASFVVFLIEERSSKSKHLQLVSGVHPTIYWIASYAWDSVNYLVSATLCIFIFLAFDEQAYVSDKNIKGLILLLLLYGWASIPLMYPASFLFSVPSSAFVALGCANLFIGIVTTVATFVLEIFDDEELQYIASIIREVFLVFPHFCLGQGLMKMATNHMALQSLSSLGLEIQINLFEWDFLGKNLFSMFVAGFVFFGFNLTVEYKILLTCWNKMRSLCYKNRTFPLLDEEEEEDVAKERLRVLSNGANDDILRLENLTKVYPSGTRPAVDQLCVGVRWGECFGLLGLNGAGKTTTFKMLTGDTHPTSGNAYVCGRSILSSSKSGCVCSEGLADGELVEVRRRQLGYCPQFDALDPLLTAREHLMLYSRLRGVPSSHINELVDDGLKKLGLGRYADRLAGTYSGGNKRKLSTAIALVGDPPLVFLDEPTSGMDVGARRFLWACILSVVRDRKGDGGKGRSVVLTSHSMEECEALCSRLTIMVNGHFRCLGSVQHLKDKFGSGYTLIVHCPSDHGAETTAEQLAARLPPGAILREAHHNRLRFQLPRGTSPSAASSSSQEYSIPAEPEDEVVTPIKLSAVFRAMEDARERGLVEDYSIMQTTLEEVFIRFANEQKDANGVCEEEEVGRRKKGRWIGGGAATCCYPQIRSVHSRRRNHKAASISDGGTV